MRKVKGITGILLAFFTIIAVLVGGYRPQTTASAAEDFRLWRQNDERWGSYSIGGSTIRQSGCYMTSIAMVAVASGARDTDSFDPGVFSKALNEINAFNQWGGLASWSSVNSVVNEISISSINLKFTSDEQSGKAAEIKKLLDEGSYVICNVGGHWVYIDGVIGDDVYMADPANDEILMFEAYPNENITIYQTLKGKETYNGFTPLYEVSSKKCNDEADSVPSDDIVTTTVLSEISVTTTTTTTMCEKATTQPAPDIKLTGEYCCKEIISKVYFEPNTGSNNDIFFEKGNIVDVTDIDNGFGEVVINGSKYWIDLTEFEFTGDVQELIAGDINNDGSADEYDLAILNEYLSSLDRLPEGVSVLTRNEIVAADINGDGTVDNTDVLMFLMHVCN